MAIQNLFGAESKLSTKAGDVTIYRLDALSKRGIGNIDKLPYSIKVLLESCLRNLDNFEVNEKDVAGLAAWRGENVKGVEMPFKPARVLLQDFTGVPVVVDLAAMRSAMKRAGGDPKKINPLVPVDLVIDHSVQVDEYANPLALLNNTRIEFQRNRERYEFLKWGQKAFDNFRVVPPATGIVHQVNLEYLARVVMMRSGVAFPDSLVGTDSHTTMINGLGVVGWGVGGIEAEACMLGQPIYMMTPQVVGFRLYGRLPDGATGTDLVLTVTQILRAHGVVEKFVEFFGEGLNSMSVADRATISNMAPEYGATIGYFPIDQQVLNYMRLTGREGAQIDLVERYCKEQGLWRTKDAEPEYSQILELDLATVVPSLAGPKRPQDRIDLPHVRKSFRTAFADAVGKGGVASTSKSGASSARGPANPQDGYVVPGADNISTGSAVLMSNAREAGLASAAQSSGTASALEPIEGNGRSLRHGSVVIAAITSCTNTSNPSVMVAAGLLAKNAVEAGLKVPPYVKTSLSPGSRVVTDYFNKADLQRYLDELGFNTTGYGCMTCIGNSGPLPEEIAGEIEGRNLVAASVLSGNRNFEGRINPHVKANYLASPPLVVAYALAGTVDIDLTKEPLGVGKDGKPVYLRDIWPAQQEVNDTVASSLEAAMFKHQYENVENKSPEWNEIPVHGGEIFEWDDDSTYIQEPPFFVDMPPEPRPVQPVRGARVLVMVGDSVTTDHISPAGSIKKDSPAGRYLMEKGVQPLDFNSYGARRGNDRVMTRGTFANIRLKNQLAPGTEGGFTTYLPTSEVTSIHDASVRYQKEQIPLLVLAGKDYGMGSSRDWAAKGVHLLGVKVVIAESFERIHRSNLVGMGVLPLVFRKGEGREKLKLTGRERYDIVGLDDSLKPRQELGVIATAEDGKRTEFSVICRIDTPVEIEYYRHGGILHRVLRQMLAGGNGA